MKIPNFTLTRILLRWLLPITILLFELTLKAQENNLQGVELIGSWTVDQEASLSSISLENQQILNQNPELRKKIYQGTSNRELIFYQDGNFEQVNGFGKRMYGTWAVNEQILTVRSTKGNIWKQSILQLSPNRLSLRQKSYGEVKPIIPILYLTKNQ